MIGTRCSLTSSSSPALRELLGDARAAVDQNVLPGCGLPRLPQGSLDAAGNEYV
jgi:hypothetical protein